MTDLMRLHVRALFTQDTEGHLLDVNEPGGAAAPRFFLGRTVRANRCWVRRDVGAAVAQELRRLCEALPVSPVLEAEPDAAASFVACLSREGAVRRIWSGPAYKCPDNLAVDSSAVRISSDNIALLDPYVVDWWEDAEAGVPMAVSLEGGKAVAVCCSVRVTDEAHEAGVETHPDFRRRGHGARAVGAWAAAVRALGAVPLYSTSWENAASIALATALGLTLFGADIHLT